MAIVNSYVRDYQKVPVFCAPWTAPLPQLRTLREPTFRPKTETQNMRNQQLFDLFALWWYIYWVYWFSNSSHHCCCICLEVGSLTSGLTSANTYPGNKSMACLVVFQPTQKEWMSLIKHFIAFPDMVEPEKYEPPKCQSALFNDMLI